MKNLFERKTTEEIIRRLNRLMPTTKRQWGKMDVSQMLAHCTSSLRLATGERQPNKILFLFGNTIGTFFKSKYYEDKPFKKNFPTSKDSRIKNKREFYKEREILIRKIVEFTEGETEEYEKNPHPFFGCLTLNEWGMGMYKHLDHHLRQFNV